MGMGGREHGSVGRVTGRIYVRKVRLDRGGYDSRGNYFGRTATPLYHVTDEDGLLSRYVRARDRQAVADQMNLPPKKLKASKKRDVRNRRRAELAWRLYMHTRDLPGGTGTSDLDALRRRALLHTKTKRRR